ncbi:Gfo/Idh/MocA family protein [Hydrogenimonas cancrithermarum]|uniref:Gfo/Idh/MocA family protein n=1 Tax=Hydrogenimonas cancrithermarum TaxID=2993563 RepID=UPI00257466E4|nr:Gfo/Idh/MocA family oxidoreductase [Hydrogenimonas cancrithermarum]
MLQVGFGSIGRRHNEILKDFEEIESIDLVSRQNIDLEGKRFSSIHDIETFDPYDYIVIANETSKHYDTLEHVVNHVNGKRILVEKPLFCRNRSLDIHDNRVFVAYNLRFHPIIEALRTILENKKILYVNILTGQYLPTWRPGTDYRDSYSASLQKGGGVLRDLSHELDYAAFLFGDIVTFSSINDKISNLEISSDDIFTAIGRTERGTILNITMDYLSKTPLRRIVVHTDEMTVEANLVESSLRIYDERGTSETIVKETARNDTYRKMHEAIIRGDAENLCTYNEGIKTMELIEKAGDYVRKDTYDQ